MERDLIWDDGSLGLAWTASREEGQKREFVLYHLQRLTSLEAMDEPREEGGRGEER
jgi:hypothetical protein